jgi:hypothetical protein
MLISGATGACHVFDTLPRAEGSEWRAGSGGIASHCEAGERMLGSVFFCSSFSGKC